MLNEYIFTQAFSGMNQSANIGFKVKMVWVTWFKQNSFVLE